MASKKELFSKVNVNPVYNVIAEATEAPAASAGNKGKADKKAYKPRKTYTDAEAAEALESLHTSGLKGVKLPRINLAFTPANYEFIKIMAQVRGQNLTEFVNDVLQQARENNADLYQQAIKFRESL